MDQLDHLSDEELAGFFRRNKTALSCVEEPGIFLNQLKDHNLIPETLVKKVIKKDSNEKTQEVYQILEWFEKNKGQNFMKEFWKCVLQEHILQKNPILHSLKSNLKGSVNCAEQISAAEKTKKKKKEKKKMKGTKRKCVDEGREEMPGPSFNSPHNQTQSNPGANPNINPQASDENQLQVTCGDKVGMLYKDRLSKGQKCIQVQGTWHTPSGFEKLAGKGNTKNWKVSILYKGIPLQKLITNDYLQIPPLKRRRVQRALRRPSFTLIRCGP